MASTGFIIAGTGVQIAGANTDWTNPGNITANDSTDAVTGSIPAAGITDILRGHNFGFAALVPAGSTIDGIEVQVKHHRIGSAVGPHTVQLSKDGTTGVGDNKAVFVTFTTAYATNTYGGAADLWNASPTRDEVASSNFSVHYRQGHTSGGGEHTGGVDYIAVNVHYTAASAVHFEATPAAGHVGLVAFAPTLSRGSTLAPNIGAVSIARFVPTVAGHVTALPISGAVAAAGQAPAIAASSLLAPQTTHFVSTGYAPTLSAGSLLQPQPAQLISTGHAPILSAAPLLQPQLARLIGTGYAPTLSAASLLQPQPARLIGTGYAPILSVGSLLQPQPARLVSTGYAPTLAVSAGIDVSTGAVRLVGHAATVETAGNFAALPGTSELHIGGFTPIWSVVARFGPNVLLAASNLQDTNLVSPPERLADIDEATDADDTEWWTAVDPTENTEVRVGFSAPPATTLIGIQRIRVLVRGTSLPSRDFKVELWENGVKLTSETTESVTSTTGQIVTLTFPASEISDLANVEVRVLSEAA